MRGRVLAGIGAGVLGRWITPGLVDEVLAEARAGLAGRLAAGEELRQQRFRALPARLGVYFVLGLCLFSGLPYGDVLRELAGGLAGALRAAGWQVPAATALTRARRRVGEEPLRLLFRRVRGPLTCGREGWSHVCGLLAVAWDGTTVKADASGANIAAFGRPRSNKTGHYPQVRLVTLVACGTRGLLGAVLGPFGKGEQTLAKDLVARLRAGMLLLADRGFYGFGLWTAAAATGADLLWRVSAKLSLPVAAALPDGSWLAHVNDPAAVRRRTARNGQRRRRGSTLGPDTGPLPGITVRVIEFWLTTTTGDGAARTERYRLITTLLDHRRYPAAALAAGYARRWAIETGFRECKTYLRGPGRILRSRTPDLTRQELWAYLAVYQAIRAVICLAAASAGLDPGRISFTATLHAVRRTLTTARTRPAAALAEIQACILTQLVPRRDGRVCVRAAIPPWWPWPSRDNIKNPHSQNATHSITIRHPAQPPTTPASQEKQPLNHQNQPP
jgi:hypothetical protein